MNKKDNILFFTIIVIFFLTSCGGNRAKEQAGSSPSPFTSLSPSASPVLSPSPPPSPSPTPESAKSDRPNILWIVTDDQRADSIATFNRVTRQSNNSALGYVSSPNIDALAKEGTMFTRAYTNSPACAPSRSSMIMGLYPHRSGRMGFEQTHNVHDLATKPFPEILQEDGYQTAIFGKKGYYIFQWENKITWNNLGVYGFEVDNKNDLQRNGLTDFYNDTVWEGGTLKGKRELFYYPDKSVNSFWTEKDGEAIADANPIDESLDILRAYTRQPSSRLIVGGVSPQPAGQTLDGHLVNEFKQYLKNHNKPYKTSFGRSAIGPDPKKPLMINLGFHFPHTPVLPPKSFRDNFIGKEYAIPDFSVEELDKLPPQLLKLHNKMNMASMTYEEKQQAIRDYYAFCAYGDDLIGEAIEAFKQYNVEMNQEYLILLTVGDHGWQLGEQGIEAKFSPWNTSNQGIIIVASSNESQFPKNQVHSGLVEYVDIAPTLLSAAGVDLETKAPHLSGHDLASVLSNNDLQRDYVIGEMNHVIGPRAYLRSDRFAFSMRTRKENGKPGQQFAPGENLQWALTATKDELELALYDLDCDKNEQSNVAYKESYGEIVGYLTTKLSNIVLGDGRVEVDWTKENTYYVSNFAEGEHDGKLTGLNELTKSCSEL